MERREVSEKNGGFFRRFMFNSAVLHNIYRFIINIVYPNICPYCNKIIDYDEDFCHECKESIVIYDGEYKIDYADEYVSYCYYKGKVRNAIRRFKYEPCGNSYYAFAFNIVQALYLRELAEEIDMVVYIPMTRRDERRRGYNQTRLIAKEIHYLLNIPCVNVLVKNRTTKNQKSLNKTDRKSNLDGAFSIRNKKYSFDDKCILIIDDVCTTGSTLSEAAKILKAAGAQKVIAATFAKTKRE